MRFEGYGDLSDFGHAIFGRILGVLLDDALLLDRFSPILFEEAIADPSLSRSG